MWDIIRRAEATLRETEAKTGLVGRYGAQRETLNAMEQSLRRLDALTQDEANTLVRTLAEQVRELKG